MDIIKRDLAAPFITLDGSEIRELMAYRNSAVRNQSLAEATIPAGTATMEHYHKVSEEIYYILEGGGLMRLEGEEQAVIPGDAIAIPPGKRHNIINTGDVPLRLLCCCAPGYEHADTFLVP